SKDVEPGQVVAANQTLLALADDSQLEIPVPLEGADVARWLEAAPGGANPNRLEILKSNDVTIRWTENPDAGLWQGQIARVENYNDQTRTLTLVVQVDGPTGNPHPTTVPLVAGMFAEVTIPGRRLDGVYRLPRAAVDVDGTVLK